MSSLQAADQEAAAVAVAPRVTLADIEAAISKRYDTTADRALIHLPDTLSTVAELRDLSICVLVMRNGFIVIGMSRAVRTENFDPELGRRFAYEDALRQLWPLMAFAMRDKLAVVSGQTRPAA